MCCPDLAIAYAEAHASVTPKQAMNAIARDFSPFVSVGNDGLRRGELAVVGVRCAGCMMAIEKGIGALPGVVKARLNFTDRRLAVEWRGALDVATLLAELDGIGYRAHPFDPKRADSIEAHESKRLLRAMAVAGFASMNVMLMLRVA